MAESEEIKEGFICPICLKDMRSPNNLLSHFQDQHSEEQDILSSLKGKLSKHSRKQSTNNAKQRRTGWQGEEKNTEAGRSRFRRLQEGTNVEKVYRNLSIH